MNRSRGGNEHDWMYYFDHYRFTFERRHVMTWYMVIISDLQLLRELKKTIVNPGFWNYFSFFEGIAILWTGHPTWKLSSTHDRIKNIGRKKKRTGSLLSNTFIYIYIYIYIYSTSLKWIWRSQDLTFRWIRSSSNSSACWLRESRFHARLTCCRWILIYYFETLQQYLQRLT